MFGNEFRNFLNVWSHMEPTHRGPNELPRSFWIDLFCPMASNFEASSIFHECFNKSCWSFERFGRTNHRKSRSLSKQCKNQNIWKTLIFPWFLHTFLLRHWDVVLVISAANAQKSIVPRHYLAGFIWNAILAFKSFQNYNWNLPWRSEGGLKTFILACHPLGFACHPLGFACHPLGFLSNSQEHVPTIGFSCIMLWISLPKSFQHLPKTWPKPSKIDWMT